MYKEVEGYNLETAQPWVLKMLAKRIKKNNLDLKYCHILDNLCKMAGYKCWNTYSAFWKEQKYETSTHVSE